MTDNGGVIGDALGTIIGAGITLKAMDIIFDKRTGKYIDKNTGEEVNMEELKNEERDKKNFKGLFS